MRKSVPAVVRFTPPNLQSVRGVVRRRVRHPMPAPVPEASLESRGEGGEMLRQYYLDHFQALIEAKPPTLEKKRGGDNEDDKEIDK